MCTSWRAPVPASVSRAPGGDVIPGGGVPRSATFVDTSALYALMDDADPMHDAAEEVFRVLVEGEPMLTHAYVVAESAALIQRRLGSDAARDLLTTLLALVDVDFVDAGLHETPLSHWSRRGIGRSPSSTGRASPSCALAASTTCLPSTPTSPLRGSWPFRRLDRRTRPSPSRRRGRSPSSSGPASGSGRGAAPDWRRGWPARARVRWPR